jgi:hypothetical protein
MARHTIEQFINEVKADHVAGRLTVFEIQALREWAGFLPGEQDEILNRLRVLRRARYRRAPQRRSTRVVRYYDESVVRS